MDSYIGFYPSFFPWYAGQYQEMYSKSLNLEEFSLIQGSQATNSTEQPKEKYQRTWTKAEIEETFNITYQYCIKFNKTIDELNIDDFAMISFGKKQTPEQIMKKIKEIKANGTLRPGKWSNAEDNLLIELIKKHKNS